VLPLIKDGRLHALAAGSSKRASSLPDVPTTLEAGIPNSDYNFWVGMFVPSRVSRVVVNRLHEQTTRALETPEVVGRMAKLGAEDMRMASDRFDAYIRKEIETNAALVKAAGIQVN
jgi:tripartite-type tricarboxylate transporter receptor subunit TctC